MITLKTLFLQHFGNACKLSNELHDVWDVINASKDACVKPMGEIAQKALVAVKDDWTIIPIYTDTSVCRKFHAKLVAAADKAMGLPEDVNDADVVIAYYSSNELKAILIDKEGDSYTGVFLVE